MGAPFSSGVSQAEGAVFLFDANWNEVKILSAFDGQKNTGFGEVVAVDGDLVAVGAPRHQVRP